jgi:23S rRNA (adenine2030-N6)-methyltransferase
MNYRHAFHAGNFADVVKHIVLLQCLDHLKKKPAPFRVIDTHAGRGLYELDAGEADKTGEWRDGAGKVLAALDRAPEAVRVALAPWSEAVRRRQPTGSLAGGLSIYPGSPVLIADALRADDALYAVELQRDERARLEALFARDRRVRTPDLDGWLAVKSLLPPVERRGLVLMDPPYETPGELQRLSAALDEGLERFKNGIYLLWYPIKDIKPVERFRRRIAELAEHHGIEVALDVELLRRPPRHPEVLNGAGVVIINAPFTLAQQLDPALAWLGRTLGESPQALGAVHRLNTRK